ncbi:DNA alkylation repair protein [Sinanaerobacter chloroacetimidivorans]|uniref:DNA alkylation repair protein n=1 Tax=Sinanaerobacter chloroacetimidivorans TaxID=2818044 RepID=A0A8J7W2Y2_9FIRM|nr:DNA alkylation repair protein [Sinanaerobacter chloroacetimidivorans]MBR0599912.1 DNA alkylation repair protein [Sinanaerobacter chloroacetimidivorans]
MYQELRDRLHTESEQGYRNFHMNLVPGIENILGVRMPTLRKLAKELAKNDWRSYLKEAPEDYYEEVLLKGLVIGLSKCSLEEKLNDIADFVPKINNWAVCDSFCNSLKFTNKHMPEMLAFIEPYLSSEEEFEVRFAVVMLLSFYIESNHIDHVLSLLNQVKHQGYYVKMAVAWALSICYIKFPEKTTPWLKTNQLDDFTHNKALQKITESLRIDQQTKGWIRSLKR